MGLKRYEKEDRQITMYVVKLGSKKETKAEELRGRVTKGELYKAKI